MDKKQALAFGRRIGSLKRKYVAQGMPESDALEKARRQARIDLGLPVEPDTAPPEQPGVTNDSVQPEPGNNRPDSGPDTEGLNIDVDPEPVKDAHDAIQDQGGTVEPGPGPEPGPEPEPEIEPDPEEVEGMVDVVDVVISTFGEPLNGRERALWRRSWFLTLKQRGVERMPWWSHIILSTVVTVPRRVIRIFKHENAD